MILVASLLVPLLAGASQPMAIWPAAYQRLDELQGGADASWELRRSGILSGDSGEARQVPIPFPFRFPGSDDVFTALNVGAKGYVSFGTHSVYSSTSSVAAETLLDTAGPRSLIAAWWGNHICDPTRGIKTKVVGAAPERAFVIEWDGCSKLVDGAPTPAIFEVQIWLYEGPDLVRVKYGDITRDASAGWEKLSWGFKPAEGPGFMGLGQDSMSAVCNPGAGAGGLPACGPEHFPASSVLQYGSTPGIDLTGRLEATSVVAHPSTLELEVETTLLNAGAADASGVGFELVLDPISGGGEIPIFVHPANQAIQAGSSRTLESLATLPRPPDGVYRLCASIDPAKTVADRDRSNNLICARRDVVIGPDLVASSIVAPPDGEPKGEVSVSFSIENIGSGGAGAFNWRLLLRASGAAGGEQILVDRWEEGLAAGDGASRTVLVRLPAIMREEGYFFELQLDADQEVGDVDRSNNQVVSEERMTNRRPELRISRPLAALEMEEGCYFGEPITATFEICNEGEAKASGFTPSVIMGDGFRVSLLEDVPAAASPQYCGIPETGGFTSCEPVAGASASCVSEFCRVECATDGDCGASGMRCEDDPALSAALGREVKGCMNYLAPSTAPREERCRTFTVTGRIPHENRYGVAYEESLQRFHVVDGGWRTLSQPDEDSIASEEVLCRPALLDLAVASVAVPSRVVAGKVAAVPRVIENLGFINPGPDGSRGERASFTYRYFLSRTAELGAKAIPVAVQATGDVGAAEIGRRGTNEGMDLLLIPPDIQPGAYHLALLLDPERELVELEKGNNIFVSEEALSVESPALRILTSELPRAILGTRYNHSFVADAGAGPYVWSAENLPPGMEISAEGVFQGRPSQAGTFVFTVSVQSAEAVRERPMAFQVLQGQSPLEVATVTLPVAVRGDRYGRWYDGAAEGYEEGVRLAASGGQPPYRWTLDPTAPGSRLPEGLVGPDAEGVIHGQATLGAGSSRFLVLVEDALGNEARRWLEILVIEADALAIPSQNFPPATTGMEYQGCVEARGGDEPYQWSVDTASLPRGLHGAFAGGEGCLEGMPIECGRFTIRMEVGDGAGQRFAGASTLEVECGTLQLSSRSLRPVGRGEAVEFRLVATPSDSPRFSLYQGLLPPGLSLGVDGVLSGTVGEDAASGSYDLIIELRDAVGRRSLGAISLVVRAEPPPPLEGKAGETGGCSSGGGGDSAVLWLVALALWFLVRSWWRNPTLSLPRRREPSPHELGGHTGSPLSWGRSPRALGKMGGNLLTDSSLASVCALFVLAAMACGGGTIEEGESRCARIACDAGLVCDEADGICKCGDQVCREGERCSLEPSPTCITTSCEFVRCERGESCSPDTGACQCGGDRCGEAQWCVDSVCVAEASCEETSCLPGMSCDPASGQCTCGGAICEDGERCVDGLCTYDRCAGVSCGANNVCDEVDGSCRCGGVDGDICSTGEACVEEGAGFACARSTKCETSACGPGTICDPADGLCRCGGVGGEFPVCEEDQSCIDGICRGDPL